MWPAHHPMTDCQKPSPIFGRCLFSVYTRRLVRSPRRLDLLDALCALLIAIWLVAWVYGILRRYFDYDEFEHFYASWRISEGARPFYDFFEGHPPFLWYPLSLVLRAFHPQSFPLFALRFGSALGHLVLLLALAKNVSLSFARLPQPASLSWRVFAIATLLVAGDLSVTWYLLEFRLDAWPDALLLWAVYRYRARAEPSFGGAFELAALSTLALLCAPKLLAFLVLFALFSLMTGERRWRRAAGLGAGALVATLTGALFLLAGGLSPIVVYRLCVTYHVILGARGGFGHGLANAILAQPDLLAILIACLAGWLLVARTRLSASTFELATIAFLVLQAAFVSFGYPQYYAPWFLLGLVFVPYLELALRPSPIAHRLAVVVGLLFAGTNVSRDLRTFATAHQTAAVVAFNAWAARVVPPDASVAGDLMHLPLYRRGVFYHLASSSPPNGYSTEAALREMNLPSSFSDRMTPAAYDRELEAARPFLIVSGNMLSSEERSAIGRYLDRHPTWYQTVSSPGGPVSLRARSDP